MAQVASVAPEQVDALLAQVAVAFDPDPKNLTI
jgi:hypothetical protein